MAKVVDPIQSGNPDLTTYTTIYISQSNNSYHEEYLQKYSKQRGLKLLPRITKNSSFNPLYHNTD